MTSKDELTTQILELAKANAVPDDVARQLADMFVPLIISVRKEQTEYLRGHYKQVAVEAVNDEMNQTCGSKSHAIKAIVKAFGEGDGSE